MNHGGLEGTFAHGMASNVKRKIVIHMETRHSVIFSRMKGFVIGREIRVPLASQMPIQLSQLQ